MTATTARLLPVQPGKVRNAIFNALSRHGVSESTAESIWLDLTTGQDPRPADVPEYMHFRGIRLTWPRGRHTRPLIKAEVDVFNAALHAAGEHREDRMLDLEDTAETARGTYWFLLNRKAGKHEVAYNPEPVRAEKMRELVAEATEARREANEPVLVFETETETKQLETDACPFSHTECLDMQDTGEGACDEHEPPTREQLIAERTAKVQMIANPEVPVNAQADPPTDVLAELRANLDALTTKLNERF